jgi:hypothetical protein
VIKLVATWVGAAVVLLLGFAVYWMGGPRNVIGFVMYGRQAKDGKLKVGDPAPDVALVALDGSTSTSLAQWLGRRPLVLVFGSFT